MKYKSKKEAQKDHIDNYRSDNFLKGYGNPNQSHYKRMMFFVDKVNDGSYVLDVGCNGGALAVMLSALKGCYVKGVDIVKELVEKAKKRGVFAEVGSAEDLSQYNDNSFDNVICGEVLEHLYDPYDAVKEAYRVLKKGGSYLVSVPHPDGFMAKNKLGDYHQQNFTYEILDTLIYSFFDRDSAKIYDVPYTDRFCMANGIKPLGQDEKGNYVFPPQWLCIEVKK